MCPPLATVFPPEGDVPGIIDCPTYTTGHLDIVSISLRREWVVHLHVPPVAAET